MVNFIAPFLNKITPNFLFGFKLCYVSRYKNTSHQNLKTANLRSNISKNDAKFWKFPDHLIVNAMIISCLIKVALYTKGSKIY